MIYRDITIFQLRNKIKKGKRIICFGGGRRLQETLSKFFKENLHDHIDFIVDNNKALQGKTLKFFGKEIPVVAPEKLQEVYKKGTHIFLITMSSPEEILGQLKSTISDRHMQYYTTPVVDMEASGAYWKKVCIIDNLTRKLPLKNTILFCGWGDMQRENETALKEYLQETHLDRKYCLIWQCDDEITNKYGIDEISRKTLQQKCSTKEIIRHFYIRNTAKYVIFENHSVHWQREGQKLIYLNHGAPPIKKTKDIIFVGPDVDFACCPSENVADIVSEQFFVSKDKLLYLGAPRFDHLFSDYNFLKEIADGSCSKTVLWVPTFRQHNLSIRVDSKKNFPFGIPVLTSEQEIENLNKILSDLKIQLIIKPHPLQNLDFIRICNYSNIFLLKQEYLDNKKIGINYLIKDADAIITDYSTIAFDFMLMDRPIAYTVDDMEDYTVGFSTSDPLKFMPGHHISTMDDMRNFLIDVKENRDSYQKKRNEIKNYVHKYQDNKNCERLVRMIGL